MENAVEGDGKRVGRDGKARRQPSKKKPPTGTVGFSEAIEDAYLAEYQERLPGPNRTTTNERPRSIRPVRLRTPAPIRNLGRERSPEKRSNSAPGLAHYLVAVRVPVVTGRHNLNVHRFGRPATTGARCTS
jgi:hypothetical protein